MFMMELLMHKVTCKSNKRSSTIGVIYTMLQSNIFQMSQVDDQTLRLLFCKKFCRGFFLMSRNFEMLACQW